MKTFSLASATRAMLLMVLLVVMLYYAQAVLIPLALAVVLAMLFIPLSNRMERVGIPRILAAVICISIFLTFVAGIVALVSWQVSDLANDAQEMKQEINKLLVSAEQFISKNFGVAIWKQRKMITDSSTPGNITGMAFTAASSVFSLMLDGILLVVYTVLLLHYRNHIKKFILKLVPVAHRDNAHHVIAQGGHVAQQYIIGLAKMIVLLWVMYGVAFSIIGVKNALFFAVICGLLEIVPFLGSMTGSSLTVLMVLAQGGGGGMALWVLFSYGSIQLVQTYLLEPMVVGSNVNINALFTILALVVGELIWGIPGMVLAIPVVGIIKIVCDQIEPLKPYGFLIGEIPSERKDEVGWINRIKGWFTRKK